MTFLDDVTVEDLDLDPYPTYERMRRGLPVGYVDAIGTWFVTRYDDVAYVAEHPELFSAEHGQSPVEITFGTPTIITVDGPDHHELRRSFDGKFRPRVVDGYIDELVRPIAKRYANALPETGHADLMAEYLEPISVQSLAAVLGLGDLDADVLRRWFKAMNLGATNFEQDPDKQARADAVIAEIDEIVLPRMRSLAVAPDDSSMSHLLHAGREPGCPRDIEFVLPSLKVAILGGMQEPGHGAGSTLVALLTQPELWEQVVARPALLARAVDEGLRWVAPIGTQLRTARVDVEVAGITIPAGAAVSAVLASANRDGAMFRDPDDFRLDRATKAQAAFGFGKHFCSGHAFARSQMQIALEVLASTRPRISLVSDRHPQFRGWEFRAPTSVIVEIS